MRILNQKIICEFVKYFAAKSEKINDEFKISNWKNQNAFEKILQNCGKHQSSSKEHAKSQNGSKIEMIASPS